MLVLTRKWNESIVIDENIMITVVEVRGDKVRLGIRAPREIPIHREEVANAIGEKKAWEDQPREDEQLGEAWGFDVSFEVIDDPLLSNDEFVEMLDQLVPESLTDQEFDRLTSIDIKLPPPRQLTQHSTGPTGRHLIAILRRLFNRRS